ncbi:MAG: hypothetical protein ACRES7_07920 [Gammaproteobacteria bacterium]
MINCEKAARLISEQLEHSLGRRRSLALRFHVLICIACRRYEAQLRWLHERLREEPRAESLARLDAAVRARIVSRLHSARADGEAQT